MNGRLLDNSNDLYLDPETHQVRRASSFKERTIRLVGTVLRTFQGECFTNSEVGVPWFDRVLGNESIFIDEVNAELKELVESIDGVEKVLEIDVSFKDRNLSGKFKIRLEDGSTETGEF